MYFLFLSLLIGCPIEPASPSSKQIQAAKAERAAEQINFSDNAEIENIKDRLDLTSQPGLMGYILLLNESGQPIYYASTKGKVTSGGKRLTKPYEVLKTDGGYQKINTSILPGASDEGTYGSSSDYIYFRTQSGQYMQWNGKYLWSNQPFRLTVSPLVVDVGVI